VLTCVTPQIAQLAGGDEQVIQVQLSDPAHQCQIAGRDRTWQTIDAALADIVQPRRPGHQWFMVRSIIALRSAGRLGGVLLPKADLQRQLTDFGLQCLDLHGRLSPGLADKYISSTSRKPAASLRDLTGMHVKLLGQFHQGLLTLDGSQR